MDSDFELCLEFPDKRLIYLPSEYLHFPLVSSEIHTMGEDFFLKYIIQRIPHKEIQEIIEKNGKIEIHGIHSRLFKKIYNKDLKKIEMDYNNWQRNFCSKRTNFYICDNILFILVYPGEDYIKHYVAMIRVIFNEFKLDVDKYCKVVIYPDLEKNLTKWTNFEKMVFKDDIVIYGYSENFIKNFKRKDLLEVVSEFENYYYRSKR